MILKIRIHIGSRQKCLRLPENFAHKVLTELSGLSALIPRFSPGGVVVFLPSYDYQNQLCSRWESTGLWDQLSRSKRVFREPRNSVDVPHRFTINQAVTSSNSVGALLICVIGGKLSEGINFNDELARAVIVIGMPYPNPNSPLLREKMAYLDRQFGSRPHYEALCMRAINQAIGRAVRHSKDYAAIFLVDRRFTRANIQQKLPDWVLRGLISATQAMQRLDAFFVATARRETQN
ncbi:unnamed protein product [Echinostoma caproni]|uniref:HELICc2 domain-containing protein n=1 Tax=Echinostoma caproni TaxID=27848 RepID=A0A183APH0_9TREM|nr:unnamed protein product [Echinostoma caproni]